MFKLLLWYTPCTMEWVGDFLDSPINIRREKIDCKNNNGIFPVSETRTLNAGITYRKDT
ncbi:MAG: hypothetical protein ACFC1C_01870 [Candidatus Malihini olakiniferum]